MMEERRNSKRQLVSSLSRRASHISRKSIKETSLPLRKKVFLGIQKQQSKRTIDVQSLVKATLQQRRSHEDRRVYGEMEEQTDENKEQYITSMLGEKPVIRKPFNPSRDNKNQSVWIAPQPLKQVRDRSQTFAFERPKPVDQDKLSSSISSHQAVFLKKVIQDKDIEIKMLQSQLMKANNENVKLIQELEGYRGKNYDETYSENLVLKENLQRVIRENVMLRGKIRQNGNNLLQKIQTRAKTAPVTVHRQRQAYIYSTGSCEAKMI